MDFRAYLLLLILASGCEKHEYTDSGMNSLKQCEGEMTNLQLFIEENVAAVVLAEPDENHKLHNCVDVNVIDELNVYKQKFSDCLFLEMVEKGTVEAQNSPYRWIDSQVLFLTTSLESCNKVDDPKLVKLLLKDAKEKYFNILDIFSNQ